MNGIFASWEGVTVSIGVGWRLRGRGWGYCSGIVYTLLYDYMKLFGRDRGWGCLCQGMELRTFAASDMTYDP